MARLARVVVPGLPHHVAQRGNRREPVFFGDEDYQAYLDLIAGAAKRSGTEIWANCLMPNHVHFIMTPATPDGLRATFAEAHRRYAARIHTRLKVTGHLWQGRFSSTAMDDGVVTVGPLLGRIDDFAAFLAAGEDEEALSVLQRSYSTSRPVGSEDWIRQLELQTQRTLAPAKRGPKPKAGADDQDNLFHTVSP